MIEWKLSESQMSWAKRDDKALCSSRDPSKEAKRWVDSLRLQPGEQEAAIVGVGAGWHLLELRKRYPHTLFHIFDSAEINLAGASDDLRLSWDEFCQSRICLYQGDEAFELAAILQIAGPVFKFQSACSTQDLRLYETLLKHDPSIFADSCARQGFDSLERRARRISGDWAVNIKSLIASGEKVAGDEAPLGQVTLDEKMLLTLRELVR